MSTPNKLSVNTDKIKEIIFHRLAARKTVFRLLCQELKELNKQRYLALMSRTRPLSTAAYV